MSLLNKGMMNMLKSFITPEMVMDVLSGMKNEIAKKEAETGLSYIAVFSLNREKTGFDANVWTKDAEAKMTHIKSYGSADVPELLKLLFDGK